MRLNHSQRNPWLAPCLVLSKEVAKAAAWLKPLDSKELMGNARRGYGRNYWQRKVGFTDRLYTAAVEGEGLVISPLEGLACAVARERSSISSEVGSTLNFAMLLAS